MKMYKIYQFFIILLTVNFVNIFNSQLLASTSFDLIAQSEDEDEVETITEDELVTSKGIPWGGDSWSFSKVVEIQDSLVSSPVGKIVIDRHGIDKSRGSLIFKSPFSVVKPGKSVYVSLWGSKIEGCFVEMIVQVAPQEPVEAELITPNLLELGINNQILQLTPQNPDAALVGSVNYSYTEDERTISSTWYMSRQVFSIDNQAAKILSNAPLEEIKMRVNFPNNDSVIVPIGDETVASWEEAYQFNPSCNSTPISQE